MPLSATRLYLFFLFEMRFTFFPLERQALTTMPSFSEDFLPALHLLKYEFDFSAF